MPNPKDFNDLPSYWSNECPICAEWDNNQVDDHYVCQDCGSEIPYYQHSKGRGFESPLIDHTHYKPIDGCLNIGKTVVKKELCKQCFIKAYNDQFGIDPELEVKETQRPPTTREIILEERVRELENMVRQMRQTQSFGI